MALVQSLNSYSQYKDLPIDQGKIVFTEVVQCDSAVTSDLIYSSLKEWFIKTYKSANDVLQLDTPNKLIGKAFDVINVQSGNVLVKQKLHYTITISIKDGKYKYEITDLMFQTYPSTMIPNPPKNAAELYFPNGIVMKDKKGKPVALYADMKTKTLASMNSLISSLKNFVALEKKEEDW